jgi:phospholipid-binding lipoprotein MlaA
MRVRTLRLCGICVLLLLTVCGCATVPREPVALASYRALNDPLEPMNRKVFAFNQGVDKVILKPVARLYVKAIPAGGRDGIRNFIKNLNEPVVLANNLLQAEFKRAGTTACRFVINSTIGIAGVMDVAGRHGMERQVGDFGQTLYVWGVHDGPYLMLPVFGPTTPRDGFGEGIDLFMDPFFYVARHNRYRTAVNLTKLLLGGIDERARNLDVLDEVQRESVDFYAAMRSLYRQNRSAELRHGGPPPVPKEDDLYSDPGVSAPPDSAAPDSAAPASAAPPG